MKYYVVDAFASAVFKGNPAGVCVLDKPLASETMQQIAAENNLSETAFVLREKYGEYSLKWFTPQSEIDLCGHATLATAFVVANFIDIDINKMIFNSMSGDLIVTKENDSYVLDFPTRMPQKVELTNEILSLTNKTIKGAYLSRDLMIVLENEEDVKNFTPNSSKIKELSQGKGLIITAKGNNVDFVSRCFFPKMGVDEDPVTGSAHTNLIPYWAEQLDKNKLTARQLSHREGYLDCLLEGDRVKISGKAILYLIGEIYI